MCCGSAPPPPDYGPIASANEASARYAKEAADADLAFRRQVYNESLPQRQELYDLARRVAEQQLGISDESAARASEQWQDYKNTYRTNELSTMADAYGQQYLGGADRTQLNELITGGGGTMTDAARLGLLQELGNRAEEGAAAQAAQRAGGEVNRTFGQQSRMLARYSAGDPSRAAAMATRLGNQQALVSAGAANQAREATRTRGVGLRTGVANFGRNMPNTAGQAFGLATQAGSSAVGNQNAAFMSGMPYAQFATGGTGNQIGAAGLGVQANLGLGGLMNQSYAAQSQAAGQGLAGLGMLGGMALSAGGATPWWLGGA